MSAGSTHRHTYATVIKLNFQHHHRFLNLITYILFIITLRNFRMHMCLF